MLQINLKTGVDYLNEGTLQMVDINSAERKITLYFCNGNDNVMYSMDDFVNEAKVMNYLNGLIMPINWIKFSTSLQTVAVNSALFDFASFSNVNVAEVSSPEVEANSNFVSFIGGDLINKTDFDPLIAENLLTKIKQHFENYRPLIIL